MWDSESSKVLLWNQEFWGLESGVQLKESGIPLTIGIRNPSSTHRKSGIHYLESGILETRLVESGILGFGIRKTAQGILNPTNDWNPESKFQ